MKKGFLIPKSTDKSGAITTTFVPLHDKRSNSVNEGWGQSDIDLDGDPWVDRRSKIVAEDGQHETGYIHNRVDNDTNPYKDHISGPYKTYGEPMNALGAYYSKYYYTTHLKMSDYYFTWNDNNPRSHLLLWTSIFICPISGELFFCGTWQGNDVVVVTEEKLTRTIASTVKVITTTPTTSGKESEFEPMVTTGTSTFSLKSSTNSIIDDDPTKTHHQQQPPRWLKKKKVAEHGAAAWAYDCFQLRHKEFALVHRTISNSIPLVPKTEVNITAFIGSEVPYLEDRSIRIIPSFVPEDIRVQIEQRLMDIRNDRLIHGENMHLDNNMEEEEEELAWWRSRPNSS